MSTDKKTDSMRLPEGYTCADCVHIKRCLAFGYSWAERKQCDFYPNKFQLSMSAPVRKPTPPAVSGERGQNE